MENENIKQKRTKIKKNIEKTIKSEDFKNELNYVKDELKDLLKIKKTLDELILHRELEIDILKSMCKSFKEQNL